MPIDTLPNLQYNACMRILRYAAAALFCALLAGCGDTVIDVPTPTATVAPTLTPTATAVPLPTATPAATATAVPTATPMPTAIVAPTSAPALTPVSESAAAAQSALADDDSAREILSAALEAMQAADAFHADVDASFKIVQTEASFQMDEETFGDEFPIYYKGDIQAPDRTRGKLGISLGFFLLEVDIITIGEDAYITNPETGVWERVFAADTGFPSPYEFVLPPMDPAQYEDVQIVGDDTVDGAATRRISAMVRGNYLGSAYDSLYVEMWVGVEDALLRRLTMAGETSAEAQDSAGLSGDAMPLAPGDLGGAAEFSATITYTDFGRDFDIQAPIP